MQPASRVMAMLSVQDMSRALAFYAETLGGVKNYQFPEAATRESCRGLRRAWCLMAF